MRVAFLLGVVVLAAAGCGSESGSDSAADTGAGDVAATQLEITFWADGDAGGIPETWTLTCDPPGGTHPRPEEACRQLEALGTPFTPPPADEICTEQYGGPEQATVTGTYRGEPVSYKLARTNGCEISRWEQYGFLLPGNVRS